MAEASTIGLQGRASVASTRPLKAILARSQTLHLLVLAGVCIAIFVSLLKFEHGIVGRYGFAMDDAWIHATVARNFVEGNGWAIVPGRNISVSTSPSWTLVTALFYVFFSNPVLGTLCLSLCCMLGATVLSYRLIAMLTERPLIAVVGTVLLLLNPIVLWGTVSGMELPLVVLMELLTLYVYYGWEPDSKTRRVWFPIVLAIAGMTRPEMLLLIPFAIGETWWRLRCAGKPGLRTAATQALIVLACLAPYFLFNKISSSVWFPTSYYAKMQVRGVGLSAALHERSFSALEDALIEQPIAQVFDLTHKLVNHNLAGMLLMPLGALCFLRRFSTRASSRGLLIVAMTLLMPIIMGITSPVAGLSNHADRYLVIFPPLVVILACFGVELVQRSAGTIAAAVLALLMLISPVRTSGRAATLLAYDVDSTERLYHDMGVWLKENLDPNVILAVNDIGGIGYFARRQMIDVMGLASPEVWPVISRGYGARYPGRALEAYLRAQNVEYVVLSPKYYPGLTNKKAVYEPIKEWTERYDHHRLIAPQVLYKVHWDQLDKSADVAASTVQQIPD